MVLDPFLRFRNASVEIAFWESIEGAMRIVDVHVASIMLLLFHASLMIHIRRMVAEGALPPSVYPIFYAALLLFAAIQAAVLWGALRHRGAYFARYRGLAMAAQRISRTLCIAAVLWHVAGEVGTDSYVDFMVKERPSKARVLFQLVRVLFTAHGAIAFGWRFMAQYPVRWVLNAALHLFTFCPLIFIEAPILVRSFTRPSVPDGVKEALCDMAGSLSYFARVVPGHSSCDRLAAPLVVYSVRRVSYACVCLKQRCEF